MSAVSETIDSLEMPVEELHALADERALIAYIDDETQVFARCNCDGDHHGRPAGINTTGCGRSSFIDPPPNGV